jgi:ParB family chromosome partitioning protein
MTQLKRINPVRCRVWKMHDRFREYVDEKTCASLIESMRRHGQKQPALGRLLVHDKDGYDIELIYGARRLFAARHLGIDLLVAVRELDDRSALAEMDIENRVRDDISAYERGRSYQRWLAEGYFRSQTELARSLGISEAQVSRLLRFAELPSIVVEAFRTPHEIKEQWAVELAKRCSEAPARDCVIRKARELRDSLRTVDARGAYEQLLLAGKRHPVERRTRDEIIRDDGGKPVLRVAVRSNTVHLIVSRHEVHASKLRTIVDTLRQVLVGHEAAKSPAAIREST